MKYRAFTLVEIMTVSAIVAVLAAIIFPVVSQARNRSKTSVCLSNLKQIGHAISLYAVDYDDSLPLAVSSITKYKLMEGYERYGPPIDDTARQVPVVWTLLLPYGVTAQVSVCPMDRLSAAAAAQQPGKFTWQDFVGSSYDYDDEDALQGFTLNKFVYASTTVLSDDYEGFHDTLRNGLFADMHAHVLFPTQGIGVSTNAN